MENQNRQRPIENQNRQRPIGLNHLSRRFGTRRTHASLGDLARDASRNLRQSGQLELICEHNHDCPDAFHPVPSPCLLTGFRIVQTSPSVVRDTALATFVASVSQAVEDLVEMAALWSRQPLWEEEAEENGH